MHATNRKTGLSLVAALVAAALVAPPVLADGEPVRIQRQNVQIILDDPDPVGRLAVRDKPRDPRRDQADAQGGVEPAEPVPLPVLWWVRVALCARSGASPAICAAEPLRVPAAPRR